MKILQIAKRIAIAGFLLSAQRIGAQTPSLNGVTPVVPYGVAPFPTVYSVAYGPVTIFHPSLGDLIAKLLFPVIFVFVVLSGVVSPIIGYRWYIKHGGAKKWLKWLAYAPLVIVILAVIVLILLMPQVNF